MPLPKKVLLKELGKISFSDAWGVQKEYFQELIDRKVHNRRLEDAEKEALHHYFLFCEHPHVYTLGRNGKEDHLLLDQTGLQEYEATFIKINRGGDITYHGPGQIVGYPILDLDDFFTDIARYVRSIEEMVIRVLQHYGIQGDRIKGESGVWLDVGTPKARKICAVGMHLSRWVTMHGFAFNVNTDLSYFGHIVPCGITDKGVTSLQQELGRPVDLSVVKKQLLVAFEQVFEATILQTEESVEEK